jgi:hypothetical protein
MLTRPSLATSFFEEILSAPDRISFIRALYAPSNPTFETDWLEFKTDPGWEHLTEMWREALSGFANNQGGVLIWGIEARKDPATGIDVACGEKPVKDPLAFKSRLIELQRQGTDPPLGNVLVEHCALPGKPTRGFVVCLIPEGPFKPYGAEIKDRPQYYIRTGDSFWIAGPAILRTLFYPERRAAFEIEAHLSYELSDGAAGRASALFHCAMLITNRGSVTARDAYVILNTDLKREWLGDLDTPSRQRGHCTPVRSAICAG